MSTTEVSFISGFWSLKIISILKSGKIQDGDLEMTIVISLCTNARSWGRGSDSYANPTLLLRTRPEWRSLYETLANPSLRPSIYPFSGLTFIPSLFCSNLPLPYPLPSCKVNEISHNPSLLLGTFKNRPWENVHSLSGLLDGSSLILKSIFSFL